jgi:hypothetical protein
MRCQWGTTFENMQPWIVAHRYREFDTLDQALKRKFPRLEANMPKLPKKELFRALSSDVVAERRAVLEEYMSKIVSSMPSLLRSELMNDFLDITNRISGIRLMLLKASNKRVEEAVSGVHVDPLNMGPASPMGGKGPTVATPPPVPGPKSTAVPSNSKYGIEDPLGYNSRSPLGTFAAQTAGPELFAGDTEDEPVVSKISRSVLPTWTDETYFYSTGPWTTPRRRARRSTPPPWTRTRWGTSRPTSERWVSCCARATTRYNRVAPLPALAS